MDKKTTPKDCFRNKKTTVMGLGLFGGGVGITKFLVSQDANVTVTDLKSAEELSQSLKLLDGLPVKYRLGKHLEEDFSDVDLLIVNPAIPNESKFLQIAKDNNVHIDTELNIFFKLCPAPIVGITGSNGKSTTTSLIGNMLKEAGFRTWVGGNIGISLLEHIEEIKPRDMVVLEISSFQLDNLSKIKLSPHVSVVTNIAPNHLDRHKNIKDYIDAKKTIILYQKEGDFAILNYDDQVLRKWGSECKSNILWYSTKRELKWGAFPHNNEIIINYNLKKTVISCLSGIKIKGIHNIQNIMAAACVANIIGANAGSIKNAVINFSGLEHRLEFVSKINGIQYYNDSKATTPEASIAGIKAFENPIILIAGGYDKGINLNQFARECAKNTKSVILIGETAKNIQKLIQNIRSKYAKPDIYLSPSLNDSVRKANTIARHGDVVLLSPACASYDMFTNYEERGKRFKEHVRQMAVNLSC
ncbi:MAG: UDP-N-acetylmuramoyl-L-alanine--D-glutamate ligase [Candidatus Scalinduaceae bacterium]